MPVPEFGSRVGNRTYLILRPLLLGRVVHIDRLRVHSRVRVLVKVSPIQKVVNPQTCKQGGKGQVPARPVDRHLVLELLGAAVGGFGEVR